nr:MAG TPA: tail connector protein [Caudoviricetes sp.]
MINNLDTYRKLIGETEEGLIESIEALQRAKMIDVMSPFLNTKEIPDDLNYILVELTIYRFNKIGSEGMTAENKSSGSETYDSKYEDRLLDKCRKYAEDKSLYSSKWGVKLL